MKKSYHFWNFFCNAREWGISKAISYDLERTLELDEDYLEPKTLLKNTLKLPINFILATIMLPIELYKESQRAVRYMEEYNRSSTIG